MFEATIQKDWNENLIGIKNSRISWDTSIKHLARHDLLKDILSESQFKSIPKSNVSRWKYEPEDKYNFCELNTIIKQEIELIKRINQSSKIKNINQAYFKLCDTLHHIISSTKGFKSLIKKEKELVVNAIAETKNYMPLNCALKLFNISRSTYENYKAIVIHKCDASYFNWCVKRYPNQLLPKEVKIISAYMTNENYKFWSKASIYLKALRNGDLKCGSTTFYKYCRLLGFTTNTRTKKSDYYAPIKTTFPNQLWCADVTIFKTPDNTKHYIHFLMDHYSKLILGYSIEKSASAVSIKTLLENACTKYKPNQVQFLTDGGSENVNTLVSSFINTSNIPIKHMIAQKDVIFSNSMVEALNKVIKHQFLYPKAITDRKMLKRVLDESVLLYNEKRPQMSLGGNTPLETFNGLPIKLSRYTEGNKLQKALRLKHNKNNRCKTC